MTNKHLIIDAHSHLGIGFQNRPATIEEYQKIKDKYNIDYSLIMPNPPQITYTQNHSELINSLNYETYKVISTSVLKDSIFFVPIISPIYTSPSLLERYIEEYNPIALKIHLKVDASYPELISDEIIKILKKYNIPLIVHTDYSPSSNSFKEQLKNLNSAINWLNFFRKNEIKGYLTHGARLNKEVLQDVNGIDNVVIGLGPDFLLDQITPDSLEQSDYLRTLHDYVDPSKICFDVDYNWNFVNLSTNELDFESIKRLENYWSDKELDYILGCNSNSFFQIEKRLKKRR